MGLVATLIANPSNPVLVPALGEEAARAAGGARLYWLADGIACDIPLPEGSDPVEAEAAIRAVIAGKPIDLVVQEEETRRKTLLIADMDSTMITVECIDELADYAGIKPHIAAITERAMRGELDFAAALAERVALLAGMDERVIDQCLAERVRLMPGARTLIRTMTAHGARAVLVSGGFTRFAEPVAAMIGFDRAVANVLEVRDGRLTGQVLPPIVDSATKLDTLNAELAQHGLSADQAIAVGDGANDVPMIRAAGLGVAYHGHPAAVAAADAAIRVGDHHSLLWAQGYARADWVE
jgi:phosphoserine phosphatase